MPAFDRGRSFDGGPAANPERFLRNLPGCQIRATKNDRGERQGIADVVTRSPRYWPQPAAVIITDKRQEAAIVGDGPCELRQPRDGIGETRDGLRVLRACGHEEREQIYIESVSMIVSRALGVSTVGVYLTADLLQQNVAASPDPAIAGRELRQRETDDVQCERLAGQVRVGAEVARQVVLDVRELSVERQ